MADGDLGQPSRVALTDWTVRRTFRPWLACSFVGLAACAGGQSGAEGEEPAPPCAYGQAVLHARIAELAGGCVGVEVEELVSAGVPVHSSDGSVAFDGIVEPGELVRGHLFAHYAYTHSFQLNEEVAVFVGPGNYDLGLQLLLMVDGVVQIQWGKRPVQATLAELASPECPSLLSARYESNESAATARSHTATSAPTGACSP